MPHKCLKLLIAFGGILLPGDSEQDEYLHERYLSSSCNLRLDTFNTDQSKPSVRCENCHVWHPLLPVNSNSNSSNSNNQALSLMNDNKVNHIDLYI